MFNTKARIVLPDKYTDTIIKVAESEKLIKPYIFNGERADLGTSRRKNNKIVQQFYQMLYLYDEIIVTDYEWNMFDYEALTRLVPIRVLDESEQDRLIDLPKKNYILPDIEYDFAQYIKPAVIHKVKNIFNDFYRIRSKSVSLYKYTSMFYDAVFSNPPQAASIINEHNLLYTFNALEYNRKKNKKGYSARNGEYYNQLLAIIASYIEPILRDFELVQEEGNEILNPNYPIERLGLRSEKIEDFSNVYGTIKAECNKVIPALPAFDSIIDVMNFKERNQRDIYRLRNEIDNLKNILSCNGKKAMIEKAAKDIEKAAKELNYAKNLSKVDTWSIFLTLPISVTEYINELPPIMSIPMGCFGISSYLKHKHIKNKHNWIRVIR